MCLETCSYSCAFSLVICIATRYSAFRRQFSSQDGGLEIQVIDYNTQQNRLFPLLTSGQLNKESLKLFHEEEAGLYLVSGSAGDPHLFNFPEFGNHETKAGCFMSLDQKMNWECGIGICLQGTLLGNVKGFQRQLQLQPVENALVEVCRYPTKGLHGPRKPASVFGCDDKEATANGRTSGQCGGFADRLGGSHDYASIQPGLSCSTSSGFF
ncbi:hypothetical protein NE237_030669 [Protea cynaroides]|uniref:Acyl-CoA oxidase C-alpha1 domain-containing protein n=1 Tax=Protea cynaroides TaxID=273540 RepID=A0A9Q0JW99_9MAGN|nr:hypothetical protein NE237_030669 [Protea cynaroides]